MAATTDYEKRLLAAVRAARRRGVKVTVEPAGNGTGEWAVLTGAICLGTTERGSFAVELREAR